MPEESLDERLAYRASKIREQISGRVDDSYRFALADWLVAQHVRNRLISVAAYFRWIDRGRPFGEPERDWFAAEAEIARGETAQSQASADQCLRDQIIAEAAYFRWIDRGRPFGEPEEDWSAAEDQVVSAAEDQVVSGG